MNKKKIKMTIDFYRYLFFLKKKEGISLIIDLSIFGVSLISVIHNNVNLKHIDLTNFFIIIIFVFSLFNSIWDTIGKIKEIQSFTGKDNHIKINMEPKQTIIKQDCAFKLKDVKYLNKNDLDFENINVDKIHGFYAMRSIRLNKYLWDNSMKLEIDNNKREKVKKFILKNKEIVAPFFQYKYYKSRKNDQYFFNENKLCMANDMCCDQDTVRCYKSSYYNSFLTNEICMVVLKRIEDATVIYDASNFYPCEYNLRYKTYCVQPIAKSEMNNHIGVSTLAITKDNYIVLRMQNDKSQQNKEKFVPTGSGSCNWSDRKIKSFTNTIEYAMKRELWEENGDKKISPNADKVGETKILGFFRWLERGGKPEFVGITKLNCNLDAMEIDTDELKNISNSIDMDALNIDNIKDIPEIISDIRNYDNISVPLYMCLDALEIYYNERPDELKNFLNFQ
ncbi:hypothetical protein ACER0A_002855 [Haloimpatiens sp. FM7315]|uniref:hypothetical protein n=1 Tax=Haloimpatiens sp. FM7315 TaxID=3298609 RepID=UPI0035A31DB7